MSDLLSEKEAQKLFNDMSSGIRENDVTKLAELAETPVKTDEETKVDTPVVTDDNKPDETPAGDEVDDSKEDDKKDETPPDDKSAELKDDDKKEEEQPEETELDKLKKRLEAAEKQNQALRSQAGRVPHIQKRLKEYDKKLEELTKATTSPSSQPSAKITPKIAEKLKGLRETDPELADTIAAAIAEAVDGVADTSRTSEAATLKLLRDNDVNEYRAVEADRLLEMYPNAPDVFASKSWSEWKSKQSERWRSIAESDSADDVSTAFEKYANDMLIEHPELAKKDEEIPQKEALDPDAVEKAKKVEAERLRKKTTTAVVGGENAQGKVSMPDDPAALFAKYSEEIRKTRTG